MLRTAAATYVATTSSDTWARFSSAGSSGGTITPPAGCSSAGIRSTSTVVGHADILIYTRRALSRVGFPSELEGITRLGCMAGGGSQPVDHHLGPSEQAEREEGGADA